MHYYQWNIADYRADTMHLLPIEHYIYRSLIDWYYLDEKPIPKITQVVSRRLSLVSEFDKNVANVLQDFFVLEEDGWHHGRIDREIAEYQEQVQRNRENGKKGGRPKKNNDLGKAKITQVVLENNPEVSETKPHGNHMATQNNPSQSLTNNQEPINHKQNLKVKTIVELPSSTQPNEIENENFEVEVKKPKSKNLEIAEQVFSHWQRVLNHPRAVLGEKTIKLITDRIKDGFSIDALFEAIEGCSKSPHHMGQNETKTVYDSLELIFRNSENTNRFIAMNTKQKPLRVSVDGLSDAANVTANAAMDWIDSMQSGEFSSDDESY